MVEREATGHTTTVREQREMKAVFGFFLLFSPRLQPRKWCGPHSGWGFPPQPILGNCAHTCLEVCLWVLLRPVK